MATQLQMRRGTQSEHTSFTGAEGEVSVNTTNESLHVHNGSAAGGFELARADLDNVSDTDLNAALTGNTIGSLTITTADITNLSLGGVSVTSTAAELNFVDGVTSSIQTQIDTKAPLASPTFTGTVTAAALTVDTDTLHVDATNNRVGIGTSSPVSELHVKSSGTSSDILTVQNSTGNGSWRVKEGGSSNALLQGYNASNSEAIRLDPTSDTFFNGGNFGIGTSSPQKTLDVKGTFAISNSTTSYWDFDRDDSDGSLKIADTGTERMRISGGNLLVGKTAANNGAVGIQAMAAGDINATVSNDTVARLNRLSSDGEILRFQKDTATVGSIGAASGDLNINGPAGHSGIRFQASSILPRYNGADTDGTVDLGYDDGTATHRWKDLYLSGGAYLGGTAAANKLDHYEEVAWTPTQAGVTLSVSKARALRVGNLVTLHARITWPSNSDSTTVALGGLPFTYQNTWEGTGNIMAYNAGLDSSRPQLNSYVGGSAINFYKTGSGVAWVALNNASLSGAQVIFTVSYLTS